MAEDQAVALIDRHEAAIEHIAKVTGDRALAELVGVESLPVHSNARIRFTAERKAVFLNAIAKGASPSMACQLAGINLGTFYWHKERSPAFAAAFKLARDVDGHDLRDGLRKQARSGNMVASIFLLKELDPSFREAGNNVTINQQFNVTGRLDAARQRLKIAGK